MREQLTAARSLVHLSTDLWTSPHYHALLAVCAHWFDKVYKLQKALLGLPECRYSHSGKSQAALIADVLRNYAITKVGYHTSDNATSNDTCIEALSQILRSDHGVCSTVSSIETQLI